MARTKLGVVALILLAGSVVCGAAAPELVQVGKLKVEAKIEGAGSPAVIFESGFTGGLFLWGPVQSQVGNETQTLSYERAGLGRSDLSAEPRSAERIARELHALLAAKAIAPPYILVGHSAGGLYVRIFAHMYPNEIAGLVLVDPATEEDYERMQKDKTVEDLEKMGMPAVPMDVAIAPGGAAVDQSVVVTSSLWHRTDDPLRRCEGVSGLKWRKTQ
jgi:pimeloyl-ACP methyl ester carboxylesterase